MLSSFLQVAAGGAMGAMLRFAVTQVFTREPPLFPFAIIGVNILGSFLLGLVTVAAPRLGLAGMQPFFATGLIGAFTTYSVFSLEAVQLWQKGTALLAITYVGASVAASIGALVVGMALARSLPG